MKEVKLIHRQAMEKTDLALAAKSNGEPEKALALFKEAFDLEASAATLLASDYTAEPTRSVLFRSAASLALDCKQLPDAERLICTALVGKPPNEIAEELRDLLEQVYFMRHLDTRGISLHEEEIQMSIAGKLIGFGIAPTGAFLERVEKTETLLYRTAERMGKRPYRDAGRKNAQLSDAVELFMTVPRAASFAVTFRVGNNQQLSLLSDQTIAETVIDELVECLELFARGEDSQLKERIPEEAYYTNFVALANSIAPDGEDVKVVGFTTQRRGQSKTVAIPATLKTTTANAKSRSDDVAGATTVTGMLKRADSTHDDRDEIQIIDAERKRHTVIVPEGLMSDIVKPLWDSHVTITGTRKGKKILLKNIERVRVAGSGA